MPIVPIQVNPLYFTTVLLAWIIIYHVAYWFPAIVRDHTLVCWSVGPLGISVVSLRQPPLGQVVGQFACATAAVACAAYVTLFLVQPAPISGLQNSTANRVAAIAIPVLAVTAIRILSIVRDLRYPLWGEARIFTCVQRGVATGARIYFTPVGRAFLHQRFGATPGEFIRMVRS